VTQTTAIPVEPLTAAAFAPYGDVVMADSAAAIAINQGFAERYNCAATIDVANEGGRNIIAIFEARTRPQPIAIKLMERHPLGSQLFFPLQDEPWLVVVCDDPLRADSYRGFRATGRQGVNYRRNVWHHPLLVLGDGHRFLISDRAGPGQNLEEVWLPETMLLHLAA
jgi:ureidoglycolate lyase